MKTGAQHGLTLSFTNTTRNSSFASTISSLELVLGTRISTNKLFTCRILFKTPQDHVAEVERLTRAAFGIWPDVHQSRLTLVLFSDISELDNTYWFFALACLLMSSTPAENLSRSILFKLINL